MLGEDAVVFFFFKQKTAYEMLRSLVGSEMCIRDRSDANPMIEPSGLSEVDAELLDFESSWWAATDNKAVSYTHLTLPTIYSV